MRKHLVLASLGWLVASAYAGVTAFQASRNVPPPKGLLGEVVAVQACSTNSVSTATLSSVTELNVGGTVVPFTNELVTVAVTNGVGSTDLSGAGVWVYPSQKLILTGDAFPGGAVTVWVEQ